MSDEVAVRALAEKIRAAYVEAAIGSYEDASANGLCAQGAWECAVDAMRHVEISELLTELTHLRTPSQPSTEWEGNR